MPMMDGKPGIPMLAMQQGGSSSTRQDPPPYAYNALSSASQSPPPTPAPTSPAIDRKTALSPPPTTAAVGQSSNDPILPAISRTTSGEEHAHDDLLAKDAKFGELILTHIIIPRIRRDILKCRDQESLKYITQTDEDRENNVQRTRYDEQLGFHPQQYEYRYHNVESVVHQELADAGYQVKKMKITAGWFGIEIKWALRNPAREREQKGGCCC